MEKFQRIKTETGWKLSEKEIKYLREINLGNKNPIFGKSAWNKDLTKKDNSSLRKLSLSIKESWIRPGARELKILAVTNALAKPEIRKRYLEGIKNSQSPGMTGKHHSIITKRLIRKLHIKRIKENNIYIYPMLGKHEKQILDELELFLNNKIIRQYEVCGYFLDGYCQELNLAIEVDEYHHKMIMHKDKLRQQEIMDELNCSFIRIEDE